MSVLEVHKNSVVKPHSFGQPEDVPDQPLGQNFTVKLFISVINKLVAQYFCFTVSLFHASTCF